MAEMEPEIEIVSEVRHSDEQPRYPHGPGQAGECGCL